MLSNRSRSKLWIFILLVTVILLLIQTFRNNNETSSNSRRAIVTLFTENHVCEAIKNCQTYKYVPEIRSGEVSVVAFYGKDVTQESRHFYENRCPFVQLRPLSLDMYPESVQDFKNNRFKFLTIDKILHEFDTIMYADSSVHMYSNVEDGVLRQHFDSMNTKFAATGIRLLTHAPHTNYPVTHEALYSFFNVTIGEMKETTQLQAGAFLINNSPAGLNIMNRMNMCSVHPDCMAPPGAQVTCPYPGFKKNDAIVCHRFDQSAINMLLIELFGTDQSKYFEKTDMLVIKRFETCSIEE